MKTKQGYLFFVMIVMLAQACSLQKNVSQQGALLGDGKIVVVSPEFLQPEMTLLNSEETFAIAMKLKDEPTVRLQSPEQAQEFIAEDFQILAFETDTTKEDTTEQEPKLQPLIPAGAAVFAAGMALTAVSVITGGLSIFIGIGACIAGLLLTNWGYKKVKAEPEKWKGEKLALAVYYALIPVGLFLMLYPVYLLFML